MEDGEADLMRTRITGILPVRANSMGNADSETLTRARTLFVLLLLVLGLASCTHSRATDVTQSTSSTYTAIAVDRDGNIYVTQSSATGAAIEKWNPQGDRIFEASLQIHGQQFATISAIAVDEEFIYCAGTLKDPKDHTTCYPQIRRLSIKNGQPSPFIGSSKTLKDGHIQLDDWKPFQISGKTTTDAASLGASPLRALDIAGSTLYAANALAGEVCLFDTTTGEQKSKFDVHRPTAIAVDPLGQIWVGHDRNIVAAFRADGYSGVTYAKFGEVTSLTFGPGATLYGTDSSTGQVSMLDTAANPAKFVPLLGTKAKPGDTAPDRFFNLRGVAADNNGNLVTIDGETKDHPARIAKWSPDKKLLWERTASTARKSNRN
jgi:DNA-binding beta-propeller fold protein YncE